MKCHDVQVRATVFVFWAFFCCFVFPFLFRLFLNFVLNRVLFIELRAEIQLGC